jgi:multiple sugar transport system substrate-binding protein
LACAVVLLAMLGGGCQSHDAPARTELRFWAMGREGEVVQRLMPEFERRHPGVHVRVQQVPWSAAHEKLLTALVGNAMPQVFQLGSTWVAEFAALGALAPLDQRIEASPAVRAADYFPGIYDANRVDGTTWALPWYVDTRLLFYRRDLLATAGYDQPPSDWATWVDAMARVKEHAGAGNYAILLPVSEWQPPVILAMQGGADLLRDDGRYGDFQSPAFRTGFSFYLDLFRRGLAPASAEGQIANLYQDFAAGFFSFYITGPWNLGEFRDRLPPALADAWGTAPMPAPNPGEIGISIAGGASLALFSGAPDERAAWELIEYLSDPVQQAVFYGLTGDLPARQSAWTATRLSDDPRARAFWLQLQHLRAPPKIPEWERIASKIAQYAEAAVRGDLSTDEALRRLDEDVDALLEKRRWLLARRAER